MTVDLVAGLTGFVDGDVPVPVFSLVILLLNCR
jgi:hypothetical protein